MTSPDLDRLTLTIEDGTQYDLWTECVITDSFLDPCQTMQLSVAADETRFGLLGRLRKGAQFLLEINGNPVLGGFLDKVGMRSSRAGRLVTITGRDVLSPVVDSNVDPRLPVKKGMSLMDLAKLLFEEHFLLPVKVSDSDAVVIDGRNRAVGKPVKAKPKKGRRKTTDTLKEIYPKANEGGFQYFTRFAHRVGYHAWALPDGQGIVIGTPTYEQEPAGELRLVRGAAGLSNTIEESSIDSDNTRVPSHVFVRGKGSKPGDKSNPIGCAINPDAPFFKPFYLTDEESATKDHADAVARFVMGKALREALRYTVKVRGFTDPTSGRVWTVDTVVNVKDEDCGVEGLMWVEQRTFRKSRAGTFTEMTLIPADSLLLDYYAADGPPPPPENYKAAAAQIKKKPVTEREWSGVERAYISIWGTVAGNTPPPSALDDLGRTNKTF